ncbi:tetratricopeptide repeat protein [Pontibacter vulgaris]|uniref:tetratricopeptide repeat protein n=1 Tax=Pontibacter vulgaris TaxID=2905679 RepID=UPI001FA72522|nr:tetratricopeptide repeat protein [Pontibacter vulgaris]
MGYKLQMILVCTLMLCISPLYAQDTNNDLDTYIKRLKHSSATGGSETAFLTVGSDFMYAQEYLEAGNYASAEYSFANILRAHPDHAYANYQYAISLIKQKNPEKAKLAQESFQKAIALNPSLKASYAKDVPAPVAAEPKESATHANATDPDKGNPAKAKTEATGLDAYIAQLKHSDATGGKETQMFAPGQEAIQGILYYEKGEFSSAETRFSLSLAVDAENPYVNYLKAVSLAAQGNEAAAKPFYQKAIAGDKSLQARYAGDVASSKAKWNKLQAAKAVKTTPAAKVTYGGALVFGNYVCDQSVWNGPNVSPAYRNEYKGYFALKKDGTYRWLDDGGTGKYSYNAKTGVITWLSGPMKSKAPKLSKYQKGTTVAQVTVEYNGFTWQCGCNK